MKKENRYVNILKGIACILVILNHYHGNSCMSDALYTISHFGVPVFFLISGYYLYSVNGDTLERLSKKILHIGYLTILYSGLYVLDFVCQRIFLQSNLIRKDIVINDLFSYFTIGAVKSSIVWSTSLFGVGQWFLIALLEGYILFWIVYKARLGYYIEKYGLWIAGALLFFHIPVRLVLAKSGIQQILGVSIIENIVVRNVWFDAFPFMLIGFCIRTHNISIQKYRLLPLISVVAMFVSVAEMYLTRCLLGDEQQLSSVLYVGIIISVVSAFVWAISNTNDRLNPFQTFLEYIGKYLSMIVYFINIIVRTYLEPLLSAVAEGRASIVQQLFPIVVICSTLIVSDIVFRISRYLSANQHFCFPRLLVTAIIIAVLVLPVGTEWIMIGKYTGGNENVTLDRMLHKNYESTIMVTVQNSQGITVDAIEIPTEQFIGGGFDRSILIGDELYSYHLDYTSDQSAKVTMSENISQIRIWAR